MNDHIFINTEKKNENDLFLKMILLFLEQLKIFFMRIIFK